ncbi:DNA polymerase III subunit gamma/tau [Sulfuriferula sp. GW1]|uniref:DNA polymerase III subunit gamma/tau n=1 Tax=Sulfuriferula sp. GW1 TaxID=3345111 RepID=UPI0039B0C212
MTQVLARKWRPRIFADLKGQEHVVRALSNALTQNRLHHAYLFTGTRGVGKTTVARILAKCLNCETGITATPCGQCSACTQIDSGRFVDLLELDAASNTGIDNMREVLDNAQYAPTVGRFKVYIIDEVHMLSKAAFNSMLKTLEEPPEHVKFILATTDPQKIPVTVLSRCLQFNLKQMVPEMVREHLDKVLGLEGLPSEPAALRLIARAAGGSMRDALSLLDQAIAYGSGKVHEDTVRSMLGAIDQRYLFGLLNALAAGDGAALLDEADQMAARSIAFDPALQELGALLHKIALAQTVPAALPDDLPEREAILDLAQRLDAETVQLYYQIAILGRRDLALAPDEFAGFTMTLLRMLAFMPATEPARIATPSVVPPASRAAPPAAALLVAREPAAPKLAPAPPLGASAEMDVSEPVPEPAPAPEPVQVARVASIAFDGDWAALVTSLKLGGQARMLAVHSELESCAGDCLQLRVPIAHKHLAEKSYQDKLREAISAHFGRPMRLQVSLAEGEANTPVRQQNEARAARQSEAEAVIAADPFVQDVMQQFDARVVEIKSIAKEQ